MGGIYSDAALRQYALWGLSVNKYAYDASISGSKFQAYPIRVPQDWAYRKLYSGTDLRTRYTGAVVPAKLEVTNASSLFVGFLMGLVASKYLG